MNTLPVSCWVFGILISQRLTLQVMSGSQAYGI
jgi:hypothetical protein